MHSLIAVDEDGTPLTRAMTWADLRSEPYAQALKGSEAGKRIYRQTGTPIHAMSPLCKLFWLKEKQPGFFRAGRKIHFHQGIYLVATLRQIPGRSFALLRRRGCSISVRRNGIRSRWSWRGSMPEQLSEPVPCTHCESGAAARSGLSLGLPDGLPFIIGGSDGCLANLGSGAVRPGETALTIGTSGAIRMTAATPETIRRNGSSVIYLSDGFMSAEAPPIMAGMSCNGMSSSSWAEGEGADVSELERLVAEAERVAPGCEGLVFLPYLQGERAPIWDADASGVFFGVRSIHDQRHFMRAILEGVSYSFARSGRRWKRLSGPIEHIYASGGFTRSKSWLQLIADIFRKRCFVTGCGGCFGHRRRASWDLCAGDDRRLEAAASLVQVDAMYEPDAERHRLSKESTSVFHRVIWSLARPDVMNSCKADALQASSQIKNWVIFTRPFTRSLGRIPNSLRKALAKWLRLENPISLPACLMLHLAGEQASLWPVASGFYCNSRTGCDHTPV